PVGLRRVAGRDRKVAVKHTSRRISMTKLVGKLLASFVVAAFCLRGVYVEAGSTAAEAVLGSSRFRHHESLISVCYSLKGNVVVSLGADNAVRFWDEKTGEEVRSVLRPHAVYGFVLASDGKTLVLSEDSGIWVYPAQGPPFQ